MIDGEIDAQAVRCLSALPFFDNRHKTCVS